MNTTQYCHDYNTISVGTTTVCGMAAHAKIAELTAPWANQQIGQPAARAFLHSVRHATIGLCAQLPDSKALRHHAHRTQKIFVIKPC